MILLAQATAAATDFTAGQTVFFWVAAVLMVALALGVLSLCGLHGGGNAPLSNDVRLARSLLYRGCAGSGIYRCSYDPDIVHHHDGGGRCLR